MKTSKPLKFMKKCNEMNRPETIRSMKYVENLRRLMETNSDYGQLTNVF